MPEIGPVVTHPLMSVKCSNSCIEVPLLKQNELETLNPDLLSKGFLKLLLKPSIDSVQFHFNE
jgi:hypothetical protein